MKFGVRGQLTDVITSVNLVNRFRVYRVLVPQNCPFPLTSCVAFTTVCALPCDTVIRVRFRITLLLLSLVVVRVSFNNNYKADAGYAVAKDGSLLLSASRFVTVAVCESDAFGQEP